MPEMSSIHHVSFTVTDLDRSVEWYRTALELTALGEGDHPDGTGRYVLLGNATLSVLVGLHVHQDNGDERFFEGVTGLDHVGFDVGTRQALDEWATHLSSVGIEHTGVIDADLGPVNYSVVVFRDPDNIQLEVFALR